jgi:hypothetical protein
MGAKDVACTPGSSNEALAGRDNRSMAGMSPELDFANWFRMLRQLSHGAFVPVHSLRLDGLDVWPIVKSTISMSALNRLQKAPFGPKGRPGASRVSGALRKVAQHLSPLRTPTPKLDANIFCLANIAPALSIAGTLVNPHLDPLRDAFERKGLHTLTSYYDNSVDVDHAFPVVSIEWKAEAARLSRRYRSQFQEQVKDALAPAFREAEAEQLEILPEISALIERISLTLALRDIYARLFEQNRRMQALLLTNYYNPHGWAAIAAARAAGIFSVDVQHGVQGPFHHAYGWPEASSAGWNLLPDLFLCWSQAEQANLDSFAATRGRSLTIGPGIYQLDRLLAGGEGVSSPRIETVSREYQRDRSAVHRIGAEERAQDRKVVGLFLQYIENRDWVSALRAQLPADTALWVRHHPGARRLTAVPVQPDTPGVAVVDAFPLAVIIENADLVVTGYSSVGLEAAHLGRPVVAYSPLAETFLEPSCRSTGFVAAGPDPSALADAVMSALREPHGGRVSALLPPIDEVADTLLLRASAMKRA